MSPKFIEMLNSVNAEIMENPDADLIEEGIIDSLDIMTLISEIVSQFEVYIDPDDVTPENFATAQSIWELVSKYMEAKND